MQRATHARAHAHAHNLLARSRLAVPAAAPAAPPSARSHPPAALLSRRRPRNCRSRSPTQNPQHPTTPTARQASACRADDTRGEGWSGGGVALLQLLYLVHLERAVDGVHKVRRAHEADEPSHDEDGHAHEVPAEGRAGAPASSQCRGRRQSGQKRHAMVVATPHDTRHRKGQQK